METAGLQERKLNIIEQVIILNDEEVLRQVEDLINRSLKRPDLLRFTIAELRARAERANKDIADGRLIEQEDVETQTQTQTW
jgi:hypothetical protein